MSNQKKNVQHADSNNQKRKSYLEWAKIQPIDHIAKPNMPIALYIHEAMCLWVKCMDNERVLKRYITDWHLVTELPKRAQRLRALESMWKSHSRYKAEWAEAIKQAKTMRNELRNALVFGLHHLPGMQKEVRQLGKAQSQAGILQDLAALGKYGLQHHHLQKNPPLKLTDYKEAIALAAKVQDILAQKASQRVQRTDYKVYRDRAYYDVKMVVDELRRVGQYVFRNDQKNRRDFSSAYHKRARNRTRKKQNTQSTPIIKAPVSPSATNSDKGINPVPPITPTADNHVPISPLNEKQGKIIGQPPN